MVKPLKFFDIATRRTFKTSDYQIKVIRTKSGLRKVAITSYNGRTIYKFMK